MRKFRKSVIFTIFLLVVLTTSYVHLQVSLSSPEPTPRIIDPVYSVPMPVLPGGVFNITIYAGGEEVNIIGAWILAPGYNFTLEMTANFSSGSNYIITVKVPQEAEPELYDLYVRYSKGVLGSPRSVWILGDWPKNVTFMHFTDVHIGIITDGIPSTHFYDAAITLLNALNIDFAVITGDEVDVGGDAKSLRKFREMTNRARKPIFVIPGNHDHAQTDESTFKEKYYGFYVGPPYWFRVFGDFLIIGLDTGISGYVYPTQLKWLENVLKEYSDKPVKIVLIHHPIFNYGVFGKVTGSWKEINKISGKFYYSWSDNIDAAKEFMRLVEEYNITMVLAGHVHGDSVVLYNNKTWFITTTTTCAGRRSGDYRGFRIISVDNSGRVYAVGVPGSNPFKGFSSYNIEKISVTTSFDKDYKAYAVVVKTSGDFQISSEQAVLYFYVNASIPITDYSFYGNTSLIKGYEYKKFGELYLVKAVVKLAPSQSFKLVFSTYNDTTPPSVKIQLYTPRTPISGKDSVTLYISAVDTGWGLETVKVIYVTASGEGVVPVYYVSERSFRATLPPLRVQNVTVKVIAVDVAGNQAETSPLTISYKAQQQQQQGQQGQQQQQQQEEEKKETEILVTPDLTMLIVIISVAVVATVVVLVYALKKR